MAELNNSGTGQWSETDANNTSPPPDGAPVGTFPNQAEGIWRAIMGALKRYWDRSNATVTTTGSAGAYVYTPASTGFPTAYVQGETYVWRANASSVGSDTLNVNGLGAKPIYKPTASGMARIGAADIQTGQIVYSAYDGNLNSGSGGFQIAGGVASSPIPSGTRMLFMQAAAPAGWTQVTSVNDSVIRVVNDGSGGNTGGSWTIGGVAIGGTAISQAQLPGVNFSVSDPSHSHGASSSSSTSLGGSQLFQFGDTPNGGGGLPHIDNFNASNAHNLTGGLGSLAASTSTSTTINNATTGITVSSGGSGAAHTHGFSNDGTWRPAYVNCLVASKT